MREPLSIGFALRLIALVCFLLAAIGVPAGRLNLIALGLMLWVLAILVGGHAGIVAH